MSKAFTKLREELYKISSLDLESDTILYNEYIISFFNSISYLRVAKEEEIILAFKSIFYSNKEIGLKFLFFIRDIKKGLGERRIFRVLLTYLGKNEKDILINNLNLISIYGRWDDYYSLFDTPLEKVVINIFKKQLKKDITSDYPSNLAKWLKSENTSSKESKLLALKTRLLLGYSGKEYRVLLTNLRKKLNLVENNIRIYNYKNIDYKNISPSVLIKYKKAFLRNDRENYLNIKNNNIIKNKLFLENIDNLISIENVQNKNNIYLNNNIFNTNNFKNIYNKEIFKIIKNLENPEDTFIINGIEKIEGDNNKEIKVLIKTMLLYKKINLNVFRDYYLYFDKIPKFKKIYERDTVSEINNLFIDYINNNINLNTGMDLLLFTMIKNNFKQDLAPKSILFIYNKKIDLESIEINELKEKWLKAGYKIPKLKLWNLNNFNKDFYIKNLTNYTYINGYNKNIWSFLIKGKEINKSTILLEKFQDINYEINMI